MVCDNHTLRQDKIKNYALHCKNKKQIIQLSKKGNIIKKSEHLIRDPYVLDFMQIPITHKLTEKGLEQKLITNLQLFLLELGKGFAFISRQHRISIRNNHFYIDLVFYHRILKCFVLIDLKTRHVKHGDIGQMNLYLNYFKKEKVTHVLLASIRRNPKKIDGYIINTLHRMMAPVAQKYPDKVVLVKQMGESEPAYLYEIKY